MRRADVVAVLILIVAIGGIGLPALVRVREQQRLAQCQDTLRSIGVALYTFADQDPSHRVCSGLPDWLYDGCPDEHGWPADIASVGMMPPSGLLCVSNPVSVPDSFDDVIGAREEVSISRLDAVSGGTVNSGACKDFAVSYSEANDRIDLGSIKGGDPRRVDAVRGLISSGLASNYAASWFLVRTGFLLQQSPTGLVTTRRRGSARHRSSTIGPMRMYDLDRISISSTVLPMLGDASPARRETFQLQSAGLVPTRGSAATTMSGVSSYYNSRRDVIVPMLPGKTIRPVGYQSPATWKDRPYCKDLQPTEENPRGDAGMDGKLWLSDLRGWRTVHPLNGGTLSVLMFDGSVQSFVDQNGDGFINPGFDVKSPGSGRYDESTSHSKTGLADNTTEVFNGRMFALGEFNTDYAPKANFE